MVAHTLLCTQIHWYAVSVKGGWNIERNVVRRASGGNMVVMRIRNWSVCICVRVVFSTSILLSLSFACNTCGVMITSHSNCWSCKVHFFFWIFFKHNRFQARTTSECLRSHSISIKWNCESRICASYFVCLSFDVHKNRVKNTVDCVFL